jgi:hypothetical protein
MTSPVLFRVVSVFLIFFASTASESVTERAFKSKPAP